MINSPVVYRAIVTSKFRTEKMLNFYRMVGDEKGKNTIFTVFGRSEPWGPNEKDPGFAPPYPADNVDGEVDLWTNLIGAMKVDRSYMDAIIPRRDWGDDRFTNPRTFNIGDIVVTNTNRNNMTTPGVGWMVYRVVDIPDEGSCSITSIDKKQECIALGGRWTPGFESREPPRRKADGELIDMGDNYIWEYLYTIPPDVSINRCTNEHIVVPMPDEISDVNPEIDKQKRTRWGVENNITWYKDDSSLLYYIKATSLRFRAYMDSIYFPGASLPGNLGFRQLGIVVNPLEKKKNPSDPDVKATKAYYSVTGLERHSGEMIYMENRQPIIRSMDQTEEISIIFEF